MPTTSPVVVTEESVLAAIERAGKPISTLAVAEALGDIEDVNVPRLRRVLDKLNALDRIVGGGGPKRDLPPGWDVFQDDTREVLWASTATAERIATERIAQLASQRTAVEQRAAMLRAIHGAASPEQREALGMVGLLRDLAADPCYRDPGGGITTLFFEELEALCQMLGLEV